MAQFWLFCNFSSIFLPKLSELIQNGPILAVLQLFQYFPAKVVQIESEWPIFWGVLQLFQHFLTKVVQVYSEWPILTVLQLFQYFPTKVVQINSEWPILAVLQLFQYFQNYQSGLN